MTAPKKSSINTSIFPTEALLVQQFLEVLQTGDTCWGGVEVTTEWDHRLGFVDVLARTQEESLVAFEAKLTDWKGAFRQAYRNASYANRVYVLMPSSTVHRPMQFKEEFEFRGIGLCSFDGHRVQVHIKASEQEDLLGWVRRKAHAFFDEVRDESASHRSCRKGLLQLQAN